jgi:hypothetical protein
MKLGTFAVFLLFLCLKFEKHCFALWDGTVAVLGPVDSGLGTQILLGLVSTRGCIMEVQNSTF